LTFDPGRRIWWTHEHVDHLATGPPQRGAGLHPALHEKVGVIPPATRSDSGYRLYDEQSLARLAFVQRAKALGVELDDLADLVVLPTQVVDGSPTHRRLAIE